MGSLAAPCLSSPPYKNGAVAAVQNSELVKVSELGHV